MSTVLGKILSKLSSHYWSFRLKLTSGNKLKNVIIFESTPDLSDNTKAVFDEMLLRKLNKKYKLVWMLYGSETKLKSDTPNVYYLPHWYPRSKYFCKVSKLKICCNRFLEKEDEKQICIYLSHGTAMKDIRHSYRLPDSVDHCIAASPQLERFHAFVLNFDPEKTVGLGFPRNDALIRSNAPIREMLETTSKRVVVWYPTFRQHNCVKYTQVRDPIPLLHDLECAEKLNEAAARADTLIVIKPHFAQDTQYIKRMDLSNIRFIDDDFFAEHNVSSYEFVGNCDALVTDYSSIYFDYTLCDRPVAAIWEDIEEYKKKPGLVENYEYLAKGMEKVYTLEEFIAFIGRVGEGIDLLRDERREIRDYVNHSADATNSKRVVDFIMDQL